jgi:hypothetical protein
MTEIPIMIRILPMDKRNVWKDLEPNIFLRHDLPGKRKGKYHFKTGMKAKPGTIVLFQFDNHIIGSAVLMCIKRSNDPQYHDIETELDDDPEYKGAYYFDPGKIEVFAPMDNKQIQNIWGKGFKDNDGKSHPGFNRFNQTKQFLNPLKYGDFFNVLHNVRRS